MSYELYKDRLYMMPTHFGPHIGPRQDPDGKRYTLQEPAVQNRISVSFLTNPAQLEALLPPGFKPAGEPVVSIEFCGISNIPWLAGRGYNTLGVRFRARYQGTRDEAEGPFLAVLWENLADPIITGREQLGFNKIYAELPSPIQRDDGLHFTAQWLGFTFLEACVFDVKDVPGESVRDKFQQMMGDGILHYKYIPRTGGNWDQADADYATLSPAPSLPEADSPYFPRVAMGQGHLRWHLPEWRDMPTQHHIIHRLAELEQLDTRPSFVVSTYEFKDYRDQRILV